MDGPKEASFSLINSNAIGGPAGYGLNRILFSSNLGELIAISIAFFTSLPAMLFMIQTPVTLPFSFLKSILNDDSPFSCAPSQLPMKESVVIFISRSPPLIDWFDINAVLIYDQSSWAC